MTTSPALIHHVSKQIDFFSSKDNEPSEVLLGWRGIKEGTDNQYRLVHCSEKNTLRNTAFQGQQLKYSLWLSPMLTPDSSQIPEATISDICYWWKRGSCPISTVHPDLYVPVYQGDVCRKNAQVSYSVTANDERTSCSVVGRSWKGDIALGKSVLKRLG